MLRAFLQPFYVGLFCCYNLMEILIDIVAHCIVSFLTKPSSCAFTSVNHVNGTQLSFTASSHDATWQNKNSKNRRKKWRKKLREKQMDAMLHILFGYAQMECWKLEKKNGFFFLVPAYVFIKATSDISNLFWRFGICFNHEWSQYLYCT